MAALNQQAGKDIVVTGSIRLTHALIVAALATITVPSRMAVHGAWFRTEMRQIRVPMLPEP